MTMLGDGLEFHPRRNTYRRTHVHHTFLYIHVHTLTSAVPYDETDR